MAQDMERNRNTAKCKGAPFGVPRAALEAKAAQEAAELAAQAAQDERGKAGGRMAHANSPNNTNRRKKRMNQMFKRIQNNAKARVAGITERIGKIGRQSEKQNSVCPASYKSVKDRALSLFLAAAMFFELLPAISLPASAAATTKSITCRYPTLIDGSVGAMKSFSWNDHTVTATQLTSSTNVTALSGYYYVEGTVTISSRMVVKDTLTLIILNDATLIAEKGITVDSGKTLTVCEETSWSGSHTLIAGMTSATATSSSAPDGYAAIGASGGDSTATSVAGNINLFNDTIYAWGGKYAAGIGGGYAHSKTGNAISNGGTMWLYGTALTAKGGYGAAGIGGGYAYSELATGQAATTGGIIDLECYNVTATGGEGGAGIGGGYAYAPGSTGAAFSSGGTIWFDYSYCTVTAEGGEEGAGIGGGHTQGYTSTSSGGDISFEYQVYGTFVAKGGSFAADIGGGNADFESYQGGTRTSDAGNIIIGVGPR
jgi:hypothetical protein